MVRELELHVNRRMLPLRYRADDERHLVETQNGFVAEVRFRKLADGSIRREILRRLLVVKAPLPRSRSLVLVKREEGRSV